MTSDNVYTSGLWCQECRNHVAQLLSQMALKLFHQITLMEICIFSSWLRAKVDGFLFTSGEFCIPMQKLWGGTIILNVFTKKHKCLLRSSLTRTVTLLLRLYPPPY